MTSIEEKRNANLETALKKVQDPQKNFALLLNEFPFKIDKKMAFLLGFCYSDLSAPDDTISLRELFNMLREKIKPSKKDQNKEKLKILQEEEEKHFIEDKKEKTQKYETLKKPNKRSKKTTEVDEICDICLEELYQFPIHLMENCSHVFHEQCLKQYLGVEVNKKIKGRELKCPDFLCKSNLVANELKSLLTKEEIEKCLNNSLEKYIEFEAKDVSWCPNPMCKYAFINESKLSHFQCPLCSKSYCLSCRTEYQEKNHKCPISQEDSTFEHFAKGQKFKQCVKCRFWVEKSEGCNHMTCRCGNEFCYKCGGPYKACACKKEDEFCRII